MIELDRRKNHKWIMQKNVSSDEIIREFVSLLAEKKRINNNELLDELMRKGLYRGRHDRTSTNTMGVRSSEICFYMFGYKPVKNCFIPSPMAENLINQKDNLKPEENFLINLFSLQYPHPYSETNKEFQIYAGRLFVKLLIEPRIEKKLYIDEICWFLPFLETIDASSYEELVSSIIEYRSYDYDKKKQLFDSIANSDDVFSNTFHEFNYYFLRIFRGFGVIKLCADTTHNDGHLFKFRHGNGSTYRNDAYDSKEKTSGFVVLNPSLAEAADKLVERFSPFAKPTTQSTQGINSLRDWLTALYETEPLEYITAISKASVRDKEILDKIQTMVYLSKYGSHDGKEFEQSLKPVMELFRESCNIEIISNAGNTDLLCAMVDNQERHYKINIEAKTRKTGLEEINANRLDNHLQKHGSEFCIVISPRFASGISGDIEKHKIVTVRAEDFGAYCYKECKNSQDGFADFESIHRIIESHFGMDITGQIRDLTTERYGIAL